MVKIMEPKQIVRMTFILFAIVNLPVMMGSAETLSVAHKQSEELDPLQLPIILERVYLDGEMSQEKVMETVSSLEEFFEKYKEWKLIEMNDGKMIFQQQVDDISPLMKANGYFGITQDGILTIFNGKPSQSNVIQSFFQLDVKKLESKHHEQLKIGIPIKSKDNYVEVLEVFEHYSIEQEHSVE